MAGGRAGPTRSTERRHAGGGTRGPGCCHRRRSLCRQPSVSRPAVSRRSLSPRSRSTCPNFIPATCSAPDMNARPNEALLAVANVPPRSSVMSVRSIRMGGRTARPPLPVGMGRAFCGCGQTSARRLERSRATVATARAAHRPVTSWRVGRTRRGQSLGAAGQEARRTSVVARPRWAVTSQPAREAGSQCRRIRPSGSSGCPPGARRRRAVPPGGRRRAGPVRRALPAAWAARRGCAAGRRWKGGVAVRSWPPGQVRTAGQAQARALRTDAGR